MGASIFFGLLGGARKLAGHVLGFARRYPLAVALIAALCLSLWLWRGREQARDERDAAREQVAAWKDANAKATAWAKAEAKRKDRLAGQAKDNANAALKPSLAAGHAATDRFVRDNRCVRVAAPESRVERADLSGSVRAAGQPEGGGGETFVAVADTDPATCTAAVLRLDNAVNVWAADMVAKGLAR